MSVWVKDPDDQRWFEFDWSSFLAAGETISSWTVTCDSALTKLGDTATPTAVLIEVSGGVAGTKSLLTCEIFTTDASSKHNKYQTTKFVTVRVRQS